MKFLHFVGISALLLAAPSFAYELTCVSDYRPVDGPFHKVVLTIEKDGRSVARLLEQSDGPAVSHKENTTLRALTCKDQGSSGYLSIDCTGPIQLNVSEMELQGKPPHGHHSRRVIVSTTFQDKSFSFDRGPVTPGTKSYCQVTQ